jgi:hypothetical protein
MDWPRLRVSLRTVKRIARIPDDHSSHDHLNEQKLTPLSDSVAARCKAEIAAVQKEVEDAYGARVVWGLVDGFLLYWDQVRYSFPIQKANDELFFRLVCRRLLIPLMPGYSFVCRMMYSRSEDQNVLDMLPLVSCISLQSLTSAEILTFILVPLQTQSRLPCPLRTNEFRRRVLEGSAWLL